MKTIEIDLTYDDVEYHLMRVAHNNEVVEWVFPTLEDKEDILVRFVPFKDEEVEE